MACTHRFVLIVLAEEKAHSSAVYSKLLPVVVAAAVVKPSGFPVMTVCLAGG